MKKFTGTGVALVTPFDASGNVDIAALKKLVSHVTEGKVEFLVVLGTTGESVTLSGDEQARCIEAVMEANNGKLPLVIGCGGNNTAEVCKKAEALTAKYNPDGFLSVSPYYNKPSQEGIYRHYKAISEASPTPIILYNVPGRTSSNVLAETTLRIAGDCKNVVAVKEASGNLEQGMEIIHHAPEGFTVLSGDDTLALPQMAAGYEGVISVAANAIPWHFSELVRRAGAGDLAEARRLNKQILKLMELHFAEGNPAGIKASLEVLGISHRRVRLPLAEASEGLANQLKAEISALRVSER